MKVIINAVAFTPTGTLKSGWISNSATPEKANIRVNHWSNDISNGNYIHWGDKDVSYRVKWVKKMLDANYKIRFYTYLALDNGWTDVKIKDVS